tara:strand:- start:3831 stop:4343 length:513 start_codon:yes stop_codon:yes gene_type:complete
MATKFSTKHTEEEVKKFADKVIHRARFWLNRRNKNTKSANLSKSLDYNLKVYPSGALELGFKAADYFRYVEEGRKPGRMPPVSAIAKWIRIKPIKLRDAKSGRFKSKTDTNINSAAFAIAKHIGAYGVKPTWFFRDAFKMHYKRISKNIIAAYAKDVEKFMKITLKDNIK